jgi:hypothetical protein
MNAFCASENLDDFIALRSSPSPAAATPQLSPHISEGEIGFDLGEARIEPLEVLARLPRTSLPQM